MCYRRLNSTSRFCSILAVLVLVGAAGSATVSAATNDPNAGFRYETSNWTPVDISLASSDGTPALLSFYSEGTNGLRLLENDFTDADGRFVGEMRLPAHLSQVVVVVRTAERQDTLTLPIGDHAIAYAE